MLKIETVSRNETAQVVDEITHGLQTKREMESTEY
jgi:hypothetical protein